MKRIFQILVMLAVFASCDLQVLEQDSAAAENAVSISEVKFHPVGGTMRFSITSDSGWEIRPEEGNFPSWISVKPQQGSGGTVIVEMKALIAQYDINTYFRVVQNNGSEISRIKVMQEKPYLNVDVDVYNQPVSPDNINFVWDNNVQSQIVVNSNTDWNIARANASDFIYGGMLLNDWMWFSEDRGTGTSAKNGQVVKISPKDFNLDAEDRTLQFVIQGPNNVEIPFKINQGHKTLTAVNERGGDVSFAPCNAEQVNMEITSEFDSWTITSHPSWLTMDRSNGSVGITDLALNSNINQSKELILDTLVITGYINENGVAKSASRKVPALLQPFEFSLYVPGDNLTYEAYWKTGWDDAPILNLKSSGKWRFTDVPEWLSLTQSSGPGKEYKEDRGQDDQIKIIPSTINYSMKSAREAQITVASEEVNGFYETFRVTQNKYDFDYELQTNSLGTMDTDSKTMSIECSGDWKLTSSASWLKLSQTSGRGNAQIQYYAGSANNQTVDRTATITLQSTTHSNAGVSYEPKVTSITQQKFLFVVSPTTSGSFNAVDSKSYSVNVNSSVDWSTTKSDWINLSRESGSNGEFDVSITASDNYMLSERKGSVKFSNSFNQITYNLSYTQAAFQFDNKDASIHFTALNPVTTPITLAQSSSTWTVEKPDWVSVSQSSGQGAATITITPDNHHSKTKGAAPRRGEVLIKSKYFSQNNQLVKKIAISQDVYIFGVSTNAASVTQSASATVEVYCSSKWDVTNGATSWLDVTPTSGTGNGSIKISAKSKNTGKEARTATVTIKSDILTETITVTQPAGS